MNKETSQLIRERYDQLPQELKEAISASDLPKKMRVISDAHDLLLDQANSLHNEILFVLLGLEPSSEFVSTISRELHINQQKATEIAKDVNSAIFDSVRTYLMEWEQSVIHTSKDNDDSRVSSVERLGGFSIEKSEGVGGYDEETVDTTHDVKESDRESILSGIENPVPARATNETPHTDPLIDQLLNAPAKTVVQKIEKKPTQEQKTTDPYREPIE